MNELTLISLLEKGSHSAQTERMIIMMNLRYVLKLTKAAFYEKKKESFLSNLQQVGGYKQLCVSRHQRPPCCEFSLFITESNEPIGHFVPACKPFTVYFKAGQPVSELLKNSNIVIMTR